MNFILFSSGVAMGILFALTTTAGTLWTVQTALRAKWAGGLAASCALAAAQLAWGTVAAYVLVAAGGFELIQTPLRFFAAIILLWMSLSVKRARRITELSHDHISGSASIIFRRTWILAMLMPLRLLGYMAIIIAAGPPLQSARWGDPISIGVGIGVGSFSWWTFFVMLTVSFGRLVPEEISIRSLNKLRVLAIAVLIGLAMLAIVPLMTDRR